MDSTTDPLNEISHSLGHEQSHLQGYERPHINGAMTIGDRLKAARKKAGLSQGALAKAAGVDQATISNIERNVTHNSPHLVRIAKECGVGPFWLAEGRGNIEPSNVEQTSYSLSTNNGPVISWVLAGQWSEAMDLYAPGCAEEWEPLPASAGAHSFWLRVVGDSMTAPHGGVSVPEGMLILVDPDYEAAPGKLVVAKLISSQEATFKKLVQDSGRLYLAPLNPVYPMIPITEDVQIIGAVREYRCKL